MDQPQDNPLPNSQSNSLPTIETQLDADEVKSRLLKRSKQGKLPGYNADEPSALASVAAHGTPFDSKLLISHENGQIQFSLKLISMMPMLFAFLLVITIWPGLPLTDGFMSSFEWYERFVASTGIQTWYWYLPLTILPAPFAYKNAIKKSKRSALESAIETIEELKQVVGESD